MLEQLLLVSAIVFFSGMVKGYAGFGYAVAGIGLLSFFYPSKEAVIIMIAPLLIGNLFLIREIEPERLESCVTDFWIFMLTVLGGTVLGMLLIGSLPASILSSLISIFILVYAIVRSGLVDVHSQRLKKVCFRRGSFFQFAAGFAGGTVFGFASIGAVIVSYLDSIDLDRAVFVGVLSFVLFVVSAIRIAFSWFAGYYAGTELLYISLVAGLSGLVGVRIGSGLEKNTGRFYEKIVVALFLLIGFRLLLAG